MNDLTMIKNIFFFLLLGVSLSIAPGCGRMADTESSHDDHEHEDDMETLPYEVTLTGRQMDIMGVELGTFRYLNLTTSVKSSGELELPPQKKACVSVFQGGIISAINVIEGDRVRKGQVVATLENPEFLAWQQQLLTYRDDAVLLEKNYLRKKQLIEDNITSIAEYQEAEAAYNKVVNQIKVLKKRLSIFEIPVDSVLNGRLYTEIPIRAPISGYVLKISVNLGKYVDHGDELFEIVDNDHIHIDLMVYEKDIHKVRSGQPVTFSLTTQPDYLYQARIFSVGQAFEKEPKAVTVHAEIYNKSGNLLPGMYVDARIITDSVKARSVPGEAVVNEGGMAYIFILEDGTTAPEPMLTAEGDMNQDEHFRFHRVPVKTGVRDLGFIEVIPEMDLHDETQIVAKGAYYLLAEMKKGEGEDHHHH
jgi:cobalt-zinc-cadmium efflux system membrane fusion protein